MSYGFAQPIGSAPSTLIIPGLPDSAILLNATPAVPIATPLSISTDLSAFASLVLSFSYTGNAVFPAAGDYLLCLIAWRDDSDRLLWTDLFELNSHLTTGLVAHREYITLPVRGKKCSIVTDAGSGVGVSLSILALGSTKVVTKSIFGSDSALPFYVSDGIVVAANGGVLVPAAAATAYGGLTSGAARVSIAVSFATAAGSARLRGSWGSTPYGPKDIILNSTGINSTIVDSEEVMLPRRPVRYTITNIAAAGNNINNWNYNLVREEL